MHEIVAAEVGRSPVLVPTESTPDLQSGVTPLALTSGSAYPAYRMRLALRSKDLMMSPAYGSTPSPINLTLN